MPSNHDDDDAAAGHGPLSYWLAYRVWGVKGQWLALALLVGGFVVGAVVF